MTIVPCSTKLKPMTTTPDQTTTVHWYDHDCEWLTEYCDEHHLVSAVVPISILEKYRDWH